MSDDPAHREPVIDELDTDQDTQPEARHKALPSFSDVNLSVGSFLAGLEQKILHNRPPAIVVVQEHERGESVTQDGLRIDDLPVEPLDRPEPPDTSGARL